MTASIHADLNEALWGDLPKETLFPASRPLLGHYTSVEVLEKILVHNEMWFSNPLYMNDWEELQYGMNIGALQFRTNSPLIEASGSDKVHRKLVAYFDHLFYDFDTKHAIDTYVLCFSKHSPENNDGLLSMWRGYGARGSGVALVIDTTKLGTIKNSPLILSNVRYASRQQRLEWIDSKLAQLAKIVRAQPKTDENLYCVAHSWIERLKLFSLFTKHNGFSEEQEWRVVYMSERDTTNALSSMLGYMVTARGVEPKLKLTALPGVVDSSVSIEVLTDRIILGPSISTVLAENSVRKMLRLNGKASLAERVVASSIPYRS